MLSLGRIACWTLGIACGLSGCKRSEHEKKEAARNRLRAERLARQHPPRRQRPPLITGGTVVIGAQPRVTTAVPGAGDVYTDGKGHFLLWDVQARGPYSIYWGSATRWSQIHRGGASRTYYGGRTTQAGFSFRDSRLPSPAKRGFKFLGPGRVRLTCGAKQVIYTALSTRAAAKAKTQAKRIRLPIYYRPVSLLRRSGTQSYIYVDRPAVTIGPRRVFMGRANALKQLKVQRFDYYKDGGSQRFTTKQGVIWIPVALGGGLAQQPDFKPPGGKTQHLMAVPAKVGDALRRLIGDKLYADLKVARTASPCDPYLSPASGPPLPRTFMARTPGSSPRLTLHVLRARTLQQTARHELSQPVGFDIRAAALRDTFWARGLKGLASLLVYRPGVGLRQPKRLPAKLPPLVRHTRKNIDVLQGPKRQRIVLPGPRKDKQVGHLLNGGRSLVVLRENLFGLAGTKAGELWFIADLDHPRPVKLAIGLGRHTRIAAANSNRVFYLETGSYRGSRSFYQVDPFRRQVQPLQNVGVTNANNTFRFLPRAGVLVLRESSRDKFIVIYDIKRRRARRVRLPRDRQGLCVLPQGRRPERILVGNQIIDVRRARIVGVLPQLVGISAWIYDQRAGLIYFATSPTGGLNYTRVVCFDLRRIKKLGQVDLRKVGHHRTRRTTLNLDKVYDLQLRPDGSVLAIAGG